MGTRAEQIKCHKRSSTGTEISARKNAALKYRIAVQLCRVKNVSLICRCESNFLNCPFGTCDFPVKVYGRNAALRGDYCSRELAQRLRRGTFALKLDRSQNSHAREESKRAGPAGGKSARVAVGGPRNAAAARNSRASGKFKIRNAAERRAANLGAAAGIRRARARS